MVHHIQDAQRGQDPDSDLFSPGYFSGSLAGGKTEVFTACVPGDEIAGETETARDNEPIDPMDRVRRFFDASPSWEPPVAALKKALDQYIVRRDEYQTVIAGYPWFLDWGRDTLIVVRGIIAAGRLSDALSIILQFASFASDGTIPNMIRGNDTGNRDTSDAPLWLFRVCDELGRKMGQGRVLDADCKGRPLRRVLHEIVQAMVAGTPNGIVMDAESALLFSPSHFTWMDTNYPAGTPRMGYPIETQALWHGALEYLGREDESAHGKRWQDLARQVRRSVKRLFFDQARGYLSDCLHAQPGTPAAEAVADNVLRPNQLFALTLRTITDRTMAERILFACQELIVPGAIRSLADRPVDPPLPVYHDGNLVNDPNAPYIGTYGGDEDTKRKPAYHNGTAWTWCSPVFARPGRFVSAPVNMKRPYHGCPVPSN